MNKYSVALCMLLSGLLMASCDLDFIGNDDEGGEPDAELSEVVMHLRDLYGQTNGDEWHVATNWCSDKPLNEWHGIQTDDEGNVVSISLPDNNLTGDFHLDLNVFKSLSYINVDDNTLESFELWGESESLNSLSLSSCVTDRVSFEYIDDVTITDCDSLASISGRCVGLEVIDTDFRHDAHTPFGVEAETAVIRNCHMHSCGVSSDYLVFEESSTYDTWYCNTRIRMDLIDCYCSTVCGGDFYEDTIIKLENATLWQSNWDEESLVTLTCTITGREWDSLFEENGGGYDEPDAELSEVVMHLRDLYGQTNGDEWHVATNWCSDKPLNEWHGIQTDDEGNVVSISLPDNNLTGDFHLDLNVFKSLSYINVDDNTLESFELWGESESLNSLSLSSCVTDRVSFEYIDDVTITDCDSLASISGRCVGLEVIDTDFRHDAHTPFGVEAETAVIRNCHMHSCGVSSDYLVFEESSTYDTWYCNTRIRMDLIDCYCSTVCGGDFYEDTIIKLENATLWQSNWDEESLVTLTCTITGREWDSLFD